MSKTDSIQARNLEVADELYEAKRSFYERALIEAWDCGDYDKQVVPSDKRTLSDIVGEHVCNYHGFPFRELMNCLAGANMPQACGLMVRNKIAQAWAEYMVLR